MPVIGEWANKPHWMRGSKGEGTNEYHWIRAAAA